MDLRLCSDVAQPCQGRYHGRLISPRRRKPRGRTMREPLRFSGVMPANILPFTADLAIDEPAYRKHLRWLADTRGVTGIVANGHASEVSSLSREERRRALTLALDEVGGRC